MPKKMYPTQTSAQSKKNITLKDSIDALRAINVEARGSVAATSGASATSIAHHFTHATLLNLFHPAAYTVISVVVQEHAFQGFVKVKVGALRNLNAIKKKYWIHTARASANLISNAKE